MTDQSQPPQFSIAELGARFGAQLAEAYALTITKDKQLAAQATTIQELVANEAKLVSHIQDLEAQLAELKATIEVLINEPPRERAEDTDVLSSKTAKIAKGGKTIIQGNNQYYEAAEAAAALGSING